VVPLPGLPADDAGGVAGQRVLHRREQDAPAGEHGQALEGAVGDGPPGRGDLEGGRYRETVEDLAVAGVAAYGRLGLGADQPGAVPLHHQALGVQRGAVLVGELDDGLRLEGPAVQREQRRAVAERGEVAVPIHGERGEVADIGALVRRLVQGVGEALDGDGGRTGVILARVGGPSGGEAGGRRQAGGGGREYGSQTHGRHRRAGR
jgi:hypothetical protein